MQIEVITIPADQLKNLVKSGVEEALLNVKELQSTHALSGDDLEVITRKDVSELFGVSLVTVHDWMTKGVIPHYKMNGRTYFKRSEVLNSMKQVKIRRR